MMSNYLSKFRDLGNEAIVCENLSHVLDTIAQPDLNKIIENIWVIGGNAVYKVIIILILLLFYHNSHTYRNYYAVSHGAP